MLCPHWARLNPKLFALLRAIPGSLGSMLIPCHVKGMCHPHALQTQVAPSSPSKRWETLVMPQQSPFPGELQVPPLLLLILPSFWVYPSPPQVNLSIYFAFSPDLLNRRTPRLIFVARAAGGNGGCLQQGKRNKMLGSFFQLPGP